MTVINPRSNLGCAMEFFNTDDIMSDQQIIFTSMSENGLNESPDYDESFFLVRRFEYLKLLFMLIGKLPSECISRLELSSAAQYNNFFGTLKKHHPLRVTMHHGGPCVPGVLRLFVSADEKLYPCERIGDKYDYFCIGTLDTGLDFEKIEHLLNIGSMTEKECLGCWNLPNCMICANQLDCNDEQKPIRASKISCCMNEKDRVLDDMVVLCTLHEFGYDVLSEEDITL